MKKFYHALLTGVFLFIGLSGCLRDFHKEKLDKEISLLHKYLEDNSINVNPTASGLYYIEKAPGTGVLPEIGDYLLFNFTASLLENGRVIATSDEVIAQANNLYSSNSLYGPHKMQYGYITPYGVHEGLGYMREGGKSTLIFPSTLGFGSSPLGAIPGYSSLIYDLELIRIIYDPIDYEEEKITAFLNQHQYDALPDSVGLYYIEIESGEGDHPESFSRVEVLYDAMLIDGRMIATTGTNVRSFRLNSEFQIKGLKEGIKKMKSGGRAVIIVPYNLGFGANTINDTAYGYKVPLFPYSTIVFEIQLVGIYN